MTRISAVICSVLFSQLVFAQQIESFETFNLDRESFLNNAGALEEFRTDLVRLPNQYDAEWDSWSGWAISTMTDVTTPGFMNQFSSIVGSGVEGTMTYTVSFASGDGSVMKFARDDERPTQISISNSTYAYLSMLEGDAFAKRFGGENGTDPDFFTMVIRGIQDGEPTLDSVEVALADFTSDNPDEDFIANEWIDVDLTTIGICDYLLFTLKSSDVGAFGINTPLYFCADNLVLDKQTSFAEEFSNDDLQVFPNPANNLIEVRGLANQEERVQLTDLSGKLLGDYRLSFSGQIFLGGIPAGQYLMRFPDRGLVRKFSKR